ncbi:MAG TPA: ATP-binding protein [Longimicrobium sp.]|jgi:hypothetical protein|nr:ATP-binding protein [Longimicrobium sp.]
MEANLEGMRELEVLADRCLARIEQIDRILRGPVEWLIAEAQRAKRAGDGAPRFHQWVSRLSPLDTHSSRVATSLCIVTLQRVNRMRRRFSHLELKFDGLDETLRTLGKRFVPDRAAAGDDDRYFEQCCSVLNSRVLGVLNPFTAAQVFHVLMQTGEDHAHSGAGCVAFFAMVWPLYRRNPEDELDLGARIEPGRPNAYTTAKCLLPLIELRNVCLRRAKVSRRILKYLAKMRDAAGLAGHSLHHEWRVCAQLDLILLHMGEMAAISVASDQFKTAVNRLTRRLRRVRTTADVMALYPLVMRELRTVLVELQRRNASLLTDATLVLERIRSHLVEELKKGVVPRFGDCRLGFDVFAGDEDEGRNRGYVEMVARAAEKAAQLCGEVLASLAEVSNLRLVGEDESDEALHASLAAALETLDGVNRHVAELVSRPVDLQARWCHGIANREVAFTSADNFNDFDPAELVSSIAVSVRTERFTTPVQLADAVKKAVLGAQLDGSWRLLHPYFSSDGSQGIRPPAADVVWTLASALSHFPGINVADDTLFRFVDWLERTQREIRPRYPDAERDDEEHARDDRVMKAVGWAADQMREDDRVSLLTTAYSVNALLAVRDLVEHRVWELCKRRFTVVQEQVKLFDMDPVDLAAPHAERLHSLLARMGRDTQEDNAGANYSVVLHGPPGSSKTAVASALSRRLWRNTVRWVPREPRLIRVTPADFTRHGEERVESEAQLIFRLLGKVRGVTILFDEIDDLLRRRGPTRPSFLDLVIPAMLNRLQDLHEVCSRQEICFLFGTNYVERIEPALMRKGRIDRIIPVTYPDHLSRRCITERVLDPFNFAGFGVPAMPRLDEGKQWVRLVLGECEQLAAQTAGWPWSAVHGAAKDLRKSIEQWLAGFPADERAAALSSVDGETTRQNLLGKAIRANSPKSQIGLNYDERLLEQPNSEELCREVLYDMVARWNPSGLKPLHLYLVARVDEFWPDHAEKPLLSSELGALGQKQRVVVKHLSDDLEWLPHRDTVLWDAHFEAPA